MEIEERPGFFEDGGGIAINFNTARVLSFNVRSML